MVSEDKTVEDEFADFVEDVALAAASKPIAHERFRWDWEDLAGPISEEVMRLCNLAGRQDATNPGKLRIDAGETMSLGGLKPNADAIVVVDFTLFWEPEESGFFAKYNLADELLRYAAMGEEGWDVARQISQLEKTIARLRNEAACRGWSLPEVPDDSDSSNILDA